MRALIVHRNEQPLCIIGAPNAVMFSVHVDLGIAGPEMATMDALGMNDLGGERQSHTEWFSGHALESGDELKISFAEVEQATPPAREVANDSQEHMADQRWYEEQLRDNPLVPGNIVRNHPTATLRFSSKDSTSVLATFEGGREFISLRVNWDKWRPERCRVSLSSFSQEEALARKDGRDWFEGLLHQGECCVVRVDG